MEKMEHMDPQRCDRIWQRVSPELDPYPEVRAACREPSREPRTENIPERTGAAAGCAMHRRQRSRRTCVCGRYGRSCRRRNIAMPGSC